MSMFIGVAYTYVYACECDYICMGTIYPTPPLGLDMTQGQFLSGV